MPPAIVAQFAVALRCLAVAEVSQSCWQPSRDLGGESRRGELAKLSRAFRAAAGREIQPAQTSQPAMRYAVAQRVFKGNLAVSQARRDFASDILPPGPRFLQCTLF